MKLIRSSTFCIPADRTVAMHQYGEIVDLIKSQYGVRINRLAQEHDRVRVAGPISEWAGDPLD